MNFEPPKAENTPISHTSTAKITQLNSKPMESPTPSSPASSSPAPKQTFLPSNGSQPRLTRSGTFHKLTHFTPSNLRVFHSPAHNRSTAYPEEMRISQKIWGLLPAIVETLDEQVKRCTNQVHAIDSKIDKFLYLDNLRNVNQTLFYSLIQTDLPYFLPLVYTPTVGKACLTFSLNFRSPMGLFITPSMKGKMSQVLDNWYYPMVDICVASDGSRILGLGDLGANGMGIPIGKLSLYVAGAGFDPCRTLPVMFDFGVDNPKYLNDPFYLGITKPRVDSKLYNELVDEFLEAFFDKWPESVFQFEDFQTDRAFSLLERHRKKYRCFNDDIQGTGVVIAAGFCNALKIACTPSTPIDEIKLLFLGAGSAAVGVADSIVEMLSETRKCSIEQARRCIYLIDSQGLVTSWRKNRGGKPLADHKIKYARQNMKEHTQEQLKNLFYLLKTLKPLALVGLSSQPRAFTPEMLKFMTTYTKRPIILALSNPNSQSECDAATAYAATDGAALFGSGSPWPSYSHNGKILVPSQANNMFCFPGIGLGAAISQSKIISKKMLHAAVMALSDMTSPQELESGSLYPSITRVKEISAVVAAAVACQASKEHLSQVECDDWLDACKDYMWSPHYHDDAEEFFSVSSKSI